MLIANMKLARDPHTWSKPNEARVKHLEWNAEVNFEAHTIDAVPQSSWRWTIIEYMSKVSLASSTLYFCSSHAKCVISCINDALFRNRFKETRPTTTAVKFGIAFEKGIATCDAIIGAQFI